MALSTRTPGLTAPESGLRSIYYDAVSPAKVALIVQPGDQLEVSDDVAAQLLAASPQFKTEQPAPPPAVEPDPADEVTSEPEDDTPTDTDTEAPADEPDEEPAATTKPRKRAAKKS